MWMAVEDDVRDSGLDTKKYFVYRIDCHFEWLIRNIRNNNRLSVVTTIISFIFIPLPGGASNFYSLIQEYRLCRVSV
jgi:hypothetical protein